ncbi:hypothetical protein [Deinococcus aerophilus]|uniref:Uncharacterized protein n=1 Tax=Deinococcus aerophilus TaxID=522488 RepID=A0ABQ2GMD4_9DEIO|nr:hypothetical protein [Deinococcus aerophilus]GGM03660.1 hypothetical protein GCM10010841_10070 [Deinococcus aerophilus]
MKFSNVLYILGYASILLSAGNFLKGKAEDGKKQDVKERDGLFLGHWAPTFFILGKVAEDREKEGRSLFDFN